MYLQRPFKNEFRFEDRLAESRRVLSKYPDRRPVICQKSNSQIDLPDIDKKKYLVPNDLTIGQFMFIIRKRIKLRADEGIFLFIGDQIISSSSIIGHVYDLYKESDGFLYVYYSKENVFGF